MLRAASAGQVRDRATLYLSQLAGSAEEAVQPQWDVPAKNLEASLRAYLQNGATQAFDLVRLPPPPPPPTPPPTPTAYHTGLAVLHQHAGVCLIISRPKLHSSNARVWYCFCLEDWLSPGAVCQAVNEVDDKKNVRSCMHVHHNCLG